MGYRCVKCKKDVEIDEQTSNIRCPYCGYRILFKKRSSQPKNVKAR